MRKWNLVCRWKFVLSTAHLLTPLDHSVPQPMFCQDHPCEGYALDWSHTVEGNLVVGNCRGDISVWQAAEAGFIVKAERWQHPCRGGASVEDIQWSPTEPEVFACAATDGTVAFWDVRQSNCALQLQAHDADVNVLSWNRTVDHMLASGGDDGIVAVWDLRMLQQGHRAPFSRFQYHQGPITSVDWNPHEGFELASCSEDNQVSGRDTGGWGEQCMLCAPTLMLHTTCLYV